MLRHAEEDKVTSINMVLNYRDFCVIVCPHELRVHGMSVVIDMPDTEWLVYLKASSVALPSVLHAVASGEHSAAGRQPGQEDSNSTKLALARPPLFQVPAHEIQFVDPFGVLAAETHPNGTAWHTLNLGDQNHLARICVKLGNLG